MRGREKEDVAEKGEKNEGSDDRTHKCALLENHGTH